MLPGVDLRTSGSRVSHVCEKVVDGSVAETAGHQCVKASLAQC